MQPEEAPIPHIEPGRWQVDEADGPGEGMYTILRRGSAEEMFPESGTWVVPEAKLDSERESHHIAKRLADAERRRADTYLVRLTSLADDLRGIAHEQFHGGEEELREQILGAIEDMGADGARKLGYHPGTLIDLTEDEAEALLTAGANADSPVEHIIDADDLQAAVAKLRAALDTGLSGGSEGARSDDESLVACGSARHDPLLGMRGRFMAGTETYRETDHGLVPAGERGNWVSSGDFASERKARREAMLELESLRAHIRSVVATVESDPTWTGCPAALRGLLPEEADRA